MLRCNVRAACAALGLLLAAGARAAEEVYPADCFNDADPQRNDLEPPPPGSGDDTFRISDADVKRLLDDLAAAERQRADRLAADAKRRSD